PAQADPEDAEPVARLAGDVLHAGRGADELLEAPADGLLDVPRAEAWRHGGHHQHGGSELRERIHVHAWDDAAGEDEQHHAEHEHRQRVAQSEPRHRVVASPFRPSSSPRRSVEAAVSKAAGSGTSSKRAGLPRIGSPSDREERPSTTTRVPAPSSGARNSRGPASPSTWAWTFRATPASSTNKLAASPRTTAARRGTSTAGTASPTSMRTSPVVPTGSSAGMSMTSTSRRTDRDVARAAGARRTISPGNAEPVASRCSSTGVPTGRSA